MATTAVSSTPTTNIMTSMGAGSGVDTKALAQSLAASEVAPRQNIVNDRITKAQSSIAGYNAISYVLDNLKTAFAGLKDQSGLYSVSSQSSQAAAVKATGTAAVDAGSHSVTVTKLATAQKSLSSGASSKTSSVNDGRTFDLTLTHDNGSTDSINIPAGKDNLTGIASAINQANTGVTAQVINYAGTYKIMLNGTTGAGNGFSLASIPANVFSLSSPPLQTSDNGLVNVDGMSLTPSTNKLTDLIPGATLEFLAPTTGPASIDFSRDTTVVKTKLQALVTAYNDANTMLNTVSDPKSTVPNYGASLTNNSYVQAVRNEIRDLLFKPNPDANADGNMSSFLDLGFSLDKAGTLSFAPDTSSSGAKIDNLLATRLDDVVTFLTNDKSGITSFSGVKNGGAGEAWKVVDKMLLPSGDLYKRNANLNTRIADYNKDLVKLQDRMATLLASYTKQFSIMDAIVGRGKSTRDGLTNMMAAYTNSNK